jgi:ankyrin repeat protein
VSTISSGIPERNRRIQERSNLVYLKGRYLMPNADLKDIMPHPKRRWVTVLQAAILLAGCIGLFVLFSGPIGRALGIPLHLAERPKQDTLDTALCLAAIDGHERLLSYLLAHGANPNAKDDDGSPVLLFASVAGDVKVVESLLAAGAEINGRASDGSTPLIAAAAAGNTEVVLRLLAAGADLNAVNNAGVKAMNFAVWNRHTATALALIRAGVEVDSQELFFNASLLLDAVDAGEIEILESLLLHKANPETTDNAGWTPLRKAAFKGRSDMIEMLLAYGADVNSADKDGWSPFLWATAAGDVKSLQVLAAANANTHVQSKTGMTPLKKANQLGNIAVSRYLISLRQADAVETTHSTPR